MTVPMGAKIPWSSYTQREYVYIPETFNEWDRPLDIWEDAVEIGSLWDVGSYVWTPVQYERVLWKMQSEQGGLIRIAVAASTSPGGNYAYLVDWWGGEWHQRIPDDVHGFANTDSTFLLQPGVPFYFTVGAAYNDVPLRLIIQVSDYANETAVRPAQDTELTIGKTSHQISPDYVANNTFGAVETFTRQTRFLNSYGSAPDLAAEAEFLWRSDGAFRKKPSDSFYTYYHGSAGHVAFLGSSAVRDEGVPRTYQNLVYTAPYDADTVSPGGDGPYPRNRPVGPVASPPEVFEYTTNQSWPGLNAPTFEGSTPIVDEHTTFHVVQHVYAPTGTDLPSDEFSLDYTLFDVPRWQHVPHPQDNSPDGEQPVGSAALYPHNLIASMSVPQARMNLFAAREYIEYRISNEVEDYDAQVGFVNLTGAAWTFDHKPSDRSTTYYVMAEYVGGEQYEVAHPVPLSSSAILDVRLEVATFPDGTSSDVIEQTAFPHGSKISNLTAEEVWVGTPAGTINASTAPAWVPISGVMFEELFSYDGEGRWPSLLVRCKPQALTTGESVYGGEGWSSALKVQAQTPRYVNFSLPDLPDPEMNSIDGSFQVLRTRFT